MNQNFTTWFSASQFFAEFIGMFFLIFGGLGTTAFALNKFKKTPFTFAISYSFIVFLAPLISVLVLLFFNNFKLDSSVVISPISVVSNIIFSIKNNGDYTVLKSLFYLVNAHLLGVVSGALLFIYFCEKMDDFKMHKDPVDKLNSKITAVKEIFYIGLFSFLLIFNKIAIFDKKEIGFFVFNFINSTITFIFLVSTYKHGYFTTNFYLLIGHNILFLTKKIFSVHTLTHFLTTVLSFISFTIIWSSALLKIFKI